MLRLIVQGLRHHRRAQAGIFLGVAIACAVLTGALFVGDSVDYALRQIAELRLGNVTHAVDTRQRFFHQDLAEEADTGGNAAAVLQLRSMAIRQDAATGEESQVNRVQVLGVDDAFWPMAFEAGETPAKGEVLLNRRLAEALGVEAGQTIALRIEQPGLLSRGAPLASNQEDPARRTLVTVKGVIGDAQLGRFSLAANQRIPYNVFINRAWLQELVGLEGKVNLLLTDSTASGETLDGALAKAWRPEHLGLSFDRPAEGVLQLVSDRIYIDDVIADAAKGLPGAQPTLAYLVNGFEHGGKSTPYSFVVAGAVAEELANDEIVINSWLAQEIGAAAGDRITLHYAELLPSNDFEDRSRDFEVRTIISMDALANERALVPEFPGLSDVDHCADWDIGLPMEDELLEDEANELYWEDYGTTPKAFLTLAAGRALWTNQFGSITAIRFDDAPGREAEVRAVLKDAVDPAHFGLFFRPVAEQAEAAVNQAMDFGGLFLGMSFFLIIAALIFTGLLYVFSVQQRARELGILLAVGYRPAQVRRIFLGEALFVTVPACVLGVFAGAGYTRGLLYGLSHYWQGAVAGAAIPFHAEPLTALIGGSTAFLCAACTLALALRRQVRRSARELLNLDFTQEASHRDKAFCPGRALAAPALFLAAGLGLIAYAAFGGIESVAGPFFGAGALLLLAGLTAFRALLAWVEARPAPAHMGLATLALQNLVRRKGRSIGVVGLLATGYFLVFAVASMQEDLEAGAAHRESGTGGFALFAECTVPPEEEPAGLLGRDDVTSLAIQVHGADDASCLNLNYAAQPNVLGVPSETLAAMGAFTGEDRAALWDLLRDAPGEDIVPALVGDADTAMWGLQKKTGPEKGALLDYVDEAGRHFKIKLVGKLPMRLSVFQGSLLIDHAAFAERFPSETGHRMFLFDAPFAETAALAKELNKKLERAGAEVMSTVDRLREFYVVEQTYLGMFLALGALGMLLGAAGMAIVVLRNLLERRREIALLRAVGYGNAPVRRLLFIEHGILLLAGFAVGGIAAAAAVLPALLRSGSNLDITNLSTLALLIVGASIACTLAALRYGTPRNALDALRDE